MKKVILALLCLVSIHGFSQIKIGLEGGFNSASFAQSGETSAPGYRMSPASISTFNAGIASEIPFSKKIYLHLGLLYFATGTNINGQGDESGYVGSSYTAI